LVALLALLVAFGGSSYAAISLSRDSVKSRHIAPGQVKRSDLGRNAVASGKVADFSLRAKDFAAGQLPAGPKGDTGPQGPTGLRGAEGPRGPSDAYTASKNSSHESGLDPFDVTATATLTLPAGAYALFARGEAFQAGDYDGCAVGENISDPGGPSVVYDGDEIPAGGKVRLQALITLGAETEVEARCYFGFYEPGVSTGPQPAGKVDVWAVQVGQVHPQ
jgi:hypothetical protein